MKLKIPLRYFSKSVYTWTTSNIYGSGTKNLTKIEGIEGNVSKVALSDYHGAAVTEEGNLFIWGDNGYG